MPEETRGRGRPTLLTPELTQQIIGVIAAGNYVGTAAAIAGIDYATIKRWRRRGRKEIQRLAKNPRARPKASEAPFVDFCAAIQKALAIGEAKDVRRIDKAAEGAPREVITTERLLPDGTTERTTRVIEGTSPQWQAAAWRLERMFKRRWGRLKMNEHGGPGGKDLVGIESLRALFDDGRDDDDEEAEDAEDE